MQSSNVSVMTSLLIKFGIGCFALIASAATSQTLPGYPNTVAPQSEYPTADENGVDLATGGKTVYGPALTIGPANAGGIEYKPAIGGWPVDRLSLITTSCYSCDSEGFQGGSNLSAFLTIGGSNYDTQPGYPATVTAGGRIARFSSPLANGLYYTQFAEYSPVRGATLQYSSTLLANTITADYVNPVATAGSINPSTVPPGDNLYGNFVFTDSDGTRYIFTPGSPGLKQCLILRTCSQTWPVSRIERPNGEKITFHYLLIQQADGGGYGLNYRLLTVTTNHGYGIKFNKLPFTMPGFDASHYWNAAVGYNMAMENCLPFAIGCDFNNAWPNIVYDGSQGPSLYIDAAGGITSKVSTVDPISNPAGRRYTTITRPNGRIERYEFDIKYTRNQAGTGLPVTCAENGSGAPITIPCPFEHLLKYEDGVSTWNYSYLSGYAYAQVGPYITTTITRTDPAGQTRTSRSIPSGQFAFVTDELGRTISFTTVEPGQINFGRILSITYLEGNGTSFDYDVRGNVTQVTDVPKPGSTLANRVRSYSYPIGCSSLITCNKPESATDSNLNLTNYTWDPNSGYMLTESLPADANGIRPVRRYVYALMYAWVSNGAGGYQQADSPVWKMVQMRTCRKTETIGNSCAGGAVDDVVTDLDYGPQSGPNNLALRGIAVTSEGTTLRTCYGYDAKGNKISETQPNANLAACP